MMEFVQPIRDSKQIQAIKNILLAQSARNHLLFVLGINCGLRISDILQLQIGDVVNERGKSRPFYELREGKTKKGRRFPFSKNVQKAINLYLQEVGKNVKLESNLFQSRQGYQSITRQRAYQIIPGPIKTSIDANFPTNRETAYKVESEWIKTPEDVTPLALFIASQPDIGPTAQSFSLMRRDK